MVESVAPKQELTGKGINDNERGNFLNLKFTAISKHADAHNRRTTCAAAERPG
jgi:hypothetical protein